MKEESLPTTPFISDESINLLENDESDNKERKSNLFSSSRLSSSSSSSLIHEPSYPPRRIRELNSTLWDYSGCKTPYKLPRDDGRMNHSLSVGWTDFLVWPVRQGTVDVTLVSTGR